MPASPEAISKEIKLQNWNIMSPTEQAIFKKMGFYPSKQKKKVLTFHEKKAVASLKEYYVIATITCNLCGHICKESYLMKQVNYERKSREEPFLRAIPVPLEEALSNDHKVEQHLRPSCIVCKEELKRLDKDKLIKLAIKYANKSACIWR